MKLATPLAALAAATMLAALPSAASADNVTWKVEADLTYQYASKMAYPPAGVDDTTFSFRLRTVVDGLRIEDDLMKSPGTGVTTISEVRGSKLETGLDGDEMSTCTVTAVEPTGSVQLVPYERFSVARVTFSPALSVNVQFACRYPDDDPGQEMRPYSAVFGGADVPVPSIGAMMVWLPSATKDDAATRTVDLTYTDPVQCPGHTDDTVSCSMKIAGTITFKRTAFTDTDEDDLLAPPVKIKKPKVDEKAKKVRTTVRCAGCRVVNGIFTRRGDEAGIRAVASASGLVARRTFTLGDEAETLTVPIPKAKRKAVLAAGSVRVVFDIERPDGSTVRETRTAPVGG